MKHIDELIVEAMRHVLPKCGDCIHWMKKSECPREKGVMVGGPTAKELACDEFKSRKAVK